MKTSADECQIIFILKQMRDAAPGSKKARAQIVENDHRPLDIGPI